MKHNYLPKESFKRRIASLRLICNQHAVTQKKYPVKIRDVTPTPATQKSKKLPFRNRIVMRDLRGCHEHSPGVVAKMRHSTTTTGRRWHLEFRKQSVS
jgi:hypothetical protein